jgi:hypothetical protein
VWRESGDLLCASVRISHCVVKCRSEYFHGNQSNRVESINSKDESSWPAGITVTREN